MHQEELLYWSSLFKKVILVQPSLAASERVFSLLNNSFDNKQQNSLEDYVEAFIIDDDQIPNFHVGSGTRD